MMAKQATMGMRAQFEIISSPSLLLLWVAVDYWLEIFVWKSHFVISNVWQFCFETNQCCRCCCCCVIHKNWRWQLNWQSRWSGVCDKVDKWQQQQQQHVHHWDETVNTWQPTGGWEVGVVYTFLSPSIAKLMITWYILIKSVF